MVGRKHTRRPHHLGNPKTAKSRRAISVAPDVVDLLRPHVEGRAANDFVFPLPTGLPMHQSDFHERVWQPLGKRLANAGIAPFRFHDLRHTHVAWLIAGGARLPHIQARLGHESITTTIDTYGHLLPIGDELLSEIIQRAGRRSHPACAANRGRSLNPALRGGSGRRRVGGVSGVEREQHLLAVR